MVNKARRKGTVGENGVRDYLRAHGFPMAERLAGQGSLDRGDLTGIHPTVIVEVKNCVKATLAGWLKEVAVEKLNAKALIGAVWFKKAGTTDAGKWYVVLDGEDFTKLLNVWVANQVASTVGPSAVPLGGDDPSLGAAQWEQDPQHTSTPKRTCFV